MDYLPHRHTDPFWGIFWVLECIFIFTTELVGMRNELTLSTYGQQITYPLHGKRAWPGSSVIIRRLQHCSWSRAWTNKSLWVLLSYLCFKNQEKTTEEFFCSWRWKRGNGFCLCHLLHSGRKILKCFHPKITDFGIFDFSWKIPHFTMK